MSAPPLDPPVSVSTSGYEDGLGRRTLTFDREGGGMLERLHVRPELAAFEAPLRERMAKLAAFEDERFARVLRIERDADAGLMVVSAFVGGTRVSDLLDAAAGLPGGEAASPGVDAAIGFLLEILPALSALHSTAKFAHGAIAPGRLTLTPAGEIVVLDSLFGQALERLRFNPRRLWNEFQIAMPPAGPLQFGCAADVGQASLTAMMIIVGRMFREDELPGGLPSLLAEVVDIAQISGSTRLASRLQTILERTLPLPTGRPYASAGEAAAEVRQLAQEVGIPRCREALAAFIDGVGRAEDIAVSASQPSAPRMRVPAVAPEPVPAPAPAAPAIVVVPDPLDWPEAEPELAVAIDPEPALAEPEPLLAAAVDPEPVPAEPEPVLAEPAVALSEPEVDVPIQAEPMPEPVAGPKPPAPPLAAPEPDPLPDALLEMLAVITSESSTPPVPDDMVHASRTAPTPAIAREELQPDPALVSPADADAPPAGRHHFEPEPVVDSAPEIAPPATASQPVVSGKASHRKPKRGGKRGRDKDKLRSAAIPPRPAVPPPVAAPAYIPPVAGSHGRAGEPLRPSVAPQLAQAPPAVTRPAAGSTTGLRIKAEPPAGYTPVATRFDHRDITGIPYVQRGAPEAPSTAFPWKLAAAALAIMVVGVGAGRIYLSGSKAKSAAPIAASSPTPVAAAPEPATVTTGSIEIVTQPAGTRVLLDGKAAGETPLTIDSVAAGRHTLTFMTASGALKRVVRVEADKKLTIDVPVYSGWVAVFAPIPLDIAENGRGIGTTEQGRLMLPPGRHQLTLTNRELGYTAVETVQIEPGEERAITVQPVGELHANALPWAEVWIDGKKAGETPIAHLKVPLGTHDIVFKHPQFGERRVTTRVTATAPVAVTVDFSKQ